MKTVTVSVPLGWGFTGPIVAVVPASTSQSTWTGSINGGYTWTGSVPQITKTFDGNGQPNKTPDATSTNIASTSAAWNDWQLQSANSASVSAASVTSSVSKFTSSWSTPDSTAYVQSYKGTAMKPAAGGFASLLIAFAAWLF